MAFSCTIWHFCQLYVQQLHFGKKVHRKTGVNYITPECFFLSFLFFVFKLDKQLGSDFACKRHHFEAEQIEQSALAVQHGAKQLHRQTAGGIFRSLLYPLIVRHRLYKGPFLRKAELAGGCKQICQTGENALGKHIAEDALVLGLIFSAELFNPLIDLKADLKLLVVILTYKALALLHNVKILAVRQNADSICIFKAVKNKEAILTPAVIGEGHIEISDNAGTVQLAPDLI